MTSQWPRKQNPERPKQWRTPTQARNVVTGLQTKINDTIGSLSYIMNIFSISTWGERTESSSPWLPSLRQEKPSSAGATTRRWRKSTSISQKYSWVSDYKITTQMTTSWFYTIWRKRARVFKISVYCWLMSWKGILRLRVHNKNKPKLSKSELLNPKSSNHKILTLLFHRVP